jgi:hypothetical protein
VKNRFIGFNLRKIQYIIDYADLYKIEGVIIFIDFSKVPEYSIELESIHLNPGIYSISFYE